MILCPVDKKALLMDECTVSPSCDICCGDHVTMVCPNIKKMHATAIPCGYAVEGFGFLFYSNCQEQLRGKISKWARLQRYI